MNWPEWGDFVLAEGLMAATDVSGRQDYLELTRDILDLRIEALDGRRHLEAVAKPVKTPAGFTPETRITFGRSAPVIMWFGLVSPLVMLYHRLDSERYLSAAVSLAEDVANRAPRAADGAIYMHPLAPQAFVDSVYFVVPGWLSLAEVTGEERFREEAVLQLEAHMDKLRDDSGLFYHAWHEKAGQRSACLWARGNGWMAMALATICETRPEGDALRQRAVPLLQRQVAALLPLQDRSGLWHTVLDDPSTYLESSCAAAFALAIAKGVRCGVLSPELRLVADRAWQAVQDYVSPDGDFTGVSGGTLPGDAAHYDSIPVGVERFGTGIYLLAGTELR
ncbi:MAG: glycoside hydrolase family 88 protein [Dehalococcoidia bacterium]|nr:MAG: glycoside hydrolase family 88 protein [Dehalococcoidia bacterium]